VFLLGGPLNGHGAILVGSANAGALGIVARDHAHTFATMANTAARPGMESNFVDPFSCNGYRFKSTACIVPKGALVARVRRPGGALFTSFLADRYRATVVMHVTNEWPIISPAYAVGATESGLRKQYKAYFEFIQPKD